MKKELITLTAIAATGLATTVSANEVAEPNVDNAGGVRTAQTEPAFNITDAKNEPALVEKEAPKPVEVKTPTKEEVAELGASATNAQKDANKAKEVLDRANETSDKAEKKVADLKQAQADTQKIADKATPEAIQNAEKKVETAKAEVQVKEEALNSAQSSKSESDEAVSNQEKIVEGKKEEIEKLQSAVLVAKNNVQMKQNILDGTKISEEKKSAEEALEQETANVKRLSDELAKAEIEDEKHSQKIKNAENDLAEAITKVSTSNQSISSASEKVKQTQSELIKAQENLANQNPKNTIKLTDSFVEVWKELADKHYPYNYETQKELFEKYKAEQSEKLKKIASESEALNQYKSNEQDKDRAIDFEKTTREQREELSLFANDLYNQVRKQIGASEAVVTKGMIDLSEGFSDFGKYSDFVINSQSFAFYTVSNKTKTISNMDEAKRLIYEGFKRFLFDYNYYTPYYDSSTQSQGVASNYVLGEKNKKLYFALWPYLYSGEIGFAWSTLRADLVEGIPNFDKTVIKPSNSTQSNTVSNESALTALKTAEANYTKAKADLEKAESEYKEHLSIQRDVQNRLELLKSTPFKAFLVKAELAKAQKLQIEAQKRLALAQKAQDEVMTDIKFKQENLDKAKQELVDKENALKLGKDKLQQEEAELTKLQADVSAKAQAVSTAKKALQDAQEEVKQAEKELADLKGAHTRLAELKVELEKAETELKEAYKAQNEAKADYEVKSLAADQAKIAYETAKAKYEEAETKRLAELAEAKRRELEKAGYKLVPVLDEKGNIVDYTVDKVTVGTKNDKTYQAPAKATNAKAESKKQLPNTGTEESGLLALLGASVGLLALAGKRKYR
jgi:hypothetical protein